MLTHEALLMRSAQLIQASRQLVLEWQQGQMADRRCLELSAFAIDESRLIVAQSDKLILNSGTDRFLDSN